MDSRVVVNLSDTLLSLPPTRGYGNHFIIEEEYKLEGKQSVDLLFQPLGENTTVTICPIRRVKGELNTNFTLLSAELPEANNCSEMKVPHVAGSVLNNVSLLSGIEINTDKPVCILLGSTSISSVKNQNKSKPVGSSNLNNLAKRRFVLPTKMWAKQFIIIPSEKTSYTMALWCICKYIVFLNNSLCNK